MAIFNEFKIGFDQPKGKPWQLRTDTYKKQGVKGRKSTGQWSKELAKVIWQDVVYLSENRILPTKTDKFLGIHPKAYEIYYGLPLIMNQAPSKKNDKGSVLGDIFDHNGRQAMYLDDINDYEQVQDSTLLLVYKELNTCKAELKELKIEYRKNLDALNFMAGDPRVKALSVQKDMPSSQEILELYKTKHTKVEIDGQGKVKEKLKHAITTPVESMLKFLKWKKISEISTDDVVDALEHYITKQYKPKSGKNNQIPDKGKTYNRRKKTIEWFFNWTSIHWELPNPVTKRIDNWAVLDQGNDIDYLEEDERDAVIKYVKSRQDIYWHTFVSTALIMGFNAKEMRGILRSDIVFSTSKKTGKKIARLRIKRNKYRGVKTKNRTRRLKIPNELWELIQEYLESDFITDDSIFLFRARGARIDKNTETMWSTDNLSKTLNGDKTKRKKGILPPHVNCLDMRRTCASLRKRDGQSGEDLAVWLGNTIEQVHKSYARVTPDEIDD